MLGFLVCLALASIASTEGEVYRLEAEAKRNQTWYAFSQAEVWQELEEADRITDPDNRRAGIDLPNGSTDMPVPVWRIENWELKDRLAAAKREADAIRTRSLGTTYTSLPQGGAWTAEQVAGVVCQPEFTWNCNWALAVIWCESSYNPNSNTNPPYVGWWQVGNGPYDPYLNTVEAHIQYVEWQTGKRWISPWPNCPKGGD